MEKFDLEEPQESEQDVMAEFAALPEKEDSPSVAGGTMPDDIHEEDNEDLHEQFSFVEDMLGKEALNDKRNTYKLRPDNKYEVHEFETAGGKKIAVRHDDRGTFWHVEFVPGGELPKELKGRWTDEKAAVVAVQQYLAKQD